MYEHLTPIEPAARVYCAMLGHDPDQTITQDEGPIVGVPKLRPMWHLAAEKLLDLMQMLTALKQTETPTTTH